MSWQECFCCKKPLVTGDSSHGTSCKYHIKQQCTSKSCLMCDVSYDLWINRLSLKDPATDAFYWDTSLGHWESRITAHLLAAVAHLKTDITAFYTQGETTTYPGGVKTTKPVWNVDILGLYEEFNKRCTCQTCKAIF